MANIVSRLPQAPKRVRVIGFDDAPFRRGRGSLVQVAGVVCAGTRFEGLLWGKTRRDGWGATELVSSLLEGSKYLAQVHAVLLDGIAFGGLNLIDLPDLARRTGKPCIAVMRKPPDLDAMARAIRRLPGAARRLSILARAGTIHELSPFVFQSHGISPELAYETLTRTTDTGHVPEALRLAHLIGSAVVDGQSRGRA